MHDIGLGEWVNTPYSMVRFSPLTQLYVALSLQEQQGTTGVDSPGEHLRALRRAANTSRQGKVLGTRLLIRICILSAAIPKLCPGH